MSEDKKKEKQPLQVRMDEELREQAEQYAAKHQVSLQGIIRAFLRILVNEEDPRPPPPGSAEESRRKPGPGRGHKKPQKE